MNEFSENILRQIKSRRKKLGFLQSEMDNKLSYSDGNYQRIERGETAMTTDKLYAISKALECDIKFYLFEFNKTL